MYDTSNADALRAYIEEIMSDFPKRATGRTEVCFAADNGERVWLTATPLEEYVIVAMLYGVEVAVRINSDEPPKGNPFTW